MRAKYGRLHDDEFQCVLLCPQNRACLIPVSTTNKKSVSRNNHLSHSLLLSMSALFLILNSYYQNWKKKNPSQPFLRHFKIKTTSGLKCSYLCGNQYMSSCKFSLTISIILSESQNHSLGWEGLQKPNCPIPCPKEI